MGGCLPSTVRLQLFALKLTLQTNTVWQVHIAGLRQELASFDEFLAAQVADVRASEAAKTASVEAGLARQRRAQGERKEQLVLLERSVESEARAKVARLATTGAGASQIDMSSATLPELRAEQRRLLSYERQLDVASMPLAADLLAKADHHGALRYVVSSSFDVGLG